VKNLIEPKKIALLKSKPATYETVLEFLRAEALNSEVKISAGLVCKIVGVPASNFYMWRARRERNELTATQPLKLISEVVATGNKKRKYSPSDKVTLLRLFDKSSEKDQAIFLRTYGLYQSDLDRWRDLVTDAAIKALTASRQGPKSKSAEQVKIQELERELQGQEKVISKLSALVVIQKKVSEILGIPLAT
jgi:hypothetical protein